MEKSAGGVVFEHVTKRYGDVTAVADVSFRVAPAELVTLLGPSGCGKTTTPRRLAGLEARLPSELSGGQQQRVAVARSLVLEPAVLLFDEPLSNLDAKLRRRVRQEIRELQQSLSLTVIYVTHDQEEALAVSDHIIVMESGRIAQQGTPHELYESPASRFLADFIGDANLIDGELAIGA